MPELDSNSTTATGLSPATLAASQDANRAADDLAECIAEYCNRTHQQLDNVRFLRRAIAAPDLETCTYEIHVYRGGTGEWDESFPCREPGTVCNLADARDDADDIPGALYCLAHHQKREKQRADNYEPPQTYAQRSMIITAEEPDFA